MSFLRIYREMVSYQRNKNRIAEECIDIFRFPLQNASLSRPFRALMQETFFTHAVQPGRRDVALSELSPEISFHEFDPERA